MNYIIKLEARGGREEVLEALKHLPYGSTDIKVMVSTVVDDIKVKEEAIYLQRPEKLV